MTIKKATKKKTVFENPLIPDWVNYIYFTNNGFILFSETRPEIKEGKVAPFKSTARYVYMSSRALNLEPANEILVREPGKYAE